MPVTVTVTADTPEYRDVVEIETDAQGNQLVRTDRREWKPGTPQHNREQVLQRARQALVVNATYLARPAPTAAHTTAQVQALTKECSGLIRLLLDAVDDIAGT